MVKIFYGLAFLFYLFFRFVLHISPMLQGGNFVLRRDALEKIGGFDTDIEFYGEDTDTARRINKHGDVKFTFSLPAYSSGRRLAKEGIFKSGFRYSLNFFWIVFFKSPFNYKHKDIR